MLLLATMSGGISASPAEGALMITRPAFVGVTSMPAPARMLDVKKFVGLGEVPAVVAVTLTRVCAKVRGER
jgi:ABC-type proline/glycine betaine transport system permease subunit